MTPHPLRFQLFVSLAGAAFAGALATGLYAVLVDPLAIGFGARAASVAPKALLLAAGLIPLLVAGAARLGERLARPVEAVADAAERVVQGDVVAGVFGGEASEARRISLAIGSLRREIDRTPCTTAALRDAWHDLRNALAAVRASIELLEDGTLDAEGARRFTTNAARAAGELDARLEALVTWSRLATSSPAPRSAEPIQRVVRAAVDRAWPLAEARGVRLSVDTSTWRTSTPVRCDPAALIRALSNLIENACAASPGGTIRVECQDRAADGVAVEVVNEPAQVPRDVRPLLFGRGALPRGRAPGRGTGLGLAIVRAAVEAHGGRVRFVEWGPPRVRVRVELPR